MKEKLIRIAPILLIIAIAILSIITVVTVVNAFMNGGNNNQSQQAGDDSSKEEDKSVKDLLSVEQNRSVKMAVRGPIVAQENFRSYTVEVSPTYRRLITYKGYLDEVIKEVNLGNNSESYTQFVNALNKANMMKGVAFSGATGHLYDFSILKDDNVQKHLWTTTCAGSKGSLLANNKQLQNLFISQVPGNEQVVRDLGINENKR